PCIDLIRLTQIHLLAADRQDCTALALQPTADGGSDQPAMPRHPDAPSAQLEMPATCQLGRINVHCAAFHAVPGPDRLRPSHEPAPRNRPCAASPALPWPWRDRRAGG